jgi:hypothetical protein
MYIIFDNEQVDKIQEKYTVLELDTIQIGDAEPKVAYCVLQGIPLDDLPNLQRLKTLHENLMINYGHRGWKLCLQAIEQLQGRWGGELDSFYGELATRIAGFQQTDPGPDWTPVVQK